MAFRSGRSLLTKLMRGRFVYRPRSEMTTKRPLLASWRQSRRERRREHPAIDQGGRTGHPQPPVVADLDRQSATVHDHRDLPARVAEPSARGSDRAGAAAGGQGLTSSALPDAHPDAVGPLDPGELDVRATREEGMPFECGAESV